MEPITAAVHAAYEALVRHTDSVCAHGASAPSAPSHATHLQTDLSIPELNSLSQVCHRHASALRSRATEMHGRRGVGNIRRASEKAERFASGCTAQASFWDFWAEPDERERRRRTTVRT